MPIILKFFFRSFELPLLALVSFQKIRFLRFFFKLLQLEKISREKIASTLKALPRPPSRVSQTSVTALSRPRGTPSPALGSSPKETNSGIYVIIYDKYSLLIFLTLSFLFWMKMTHNFVNYSKMHIFIRYHSIIFVQVGHETTYAAIGNHHFFTIPCQRQNYQKYLRVSVKPAHRY